MFSRRQVLSTGLGLGGATLLSACTTTRPRATTPITAPPTPSLGTPAVQATLRVGVDRVDLGGVTATTWLYGGVLPGKEIRAKAGDVLAVRVENTLPVETSVHWHGIRLHNAADGVPGLTQDPIGPGGPPRCFLRHSGRSYDCRS